MLRSFLTTTLRRLARHRGFVAINVTGFAVGLAAAIMLGLFVEFELSYDAFDQLYRTQERIGTLAGAAAILAALIACLGLFLLAGAGMALLAAATVGTQAARAAMVNPARVLRRE